MTEEELEKIRKVAASAAKGPWKVGRDKWGNLIVYSPSVRNGMNNGGEVAELEFTTTQIDDANFIANARQDIPKLLDEIERLNSIIRELK